RSDSGNKLNVRVINAMTTNETSWFRDEYPFDCLKEEIFPQLFRSGVQAPRIWSAACSYGHEPFSLSITVEEFLEKNPGSFPGGVEIVGTDISTQALEYAREAQYDDLNLSRGLSGERRNKYFTREGESSHVIDRIRQRVKFFELNLLKSIYLFGKFDIVFCRNVLIYFSNENKSDILSKIETAMKPDAWLFLGASEPMMNYSDAFRMVKFPRGVAYQKKS
ncbi:MAG: protein-glutamate O-methyltransferase CheR, partial [Gammaproteobacteria bacterium]|nr:protein-glutamate O-methyltransferase CheR [Gammaproteobacteria bacterium]